jgi:alkylation response protein AidB-like acyl-CoA dehydrogenase
MSTIELSTSELAVVDQAIDELLAVADPSKTDAVTFRGLRYDRGLAWVHFLDGFGGLGLAPSLQAHVERRLLTAGAPPADISTFFYHLAGPTIVTHGTTEQKQRFLRPMFSGEQRWCQLFSEPGAGSDFAGLATRAVRDGDEWVVNGQKVWTSIAHRADWGMLVTRSDPEQPKHKGLTFFALDLRSPGVEIRPLRQMTGEAEFNEVYLTDVRVPDSCRIGAVGEGWRVALTTLMNERVSIGSGMGLSPARGSGPISDVVQTWLALPADARDPVRRDRVMRVWIRSEVQRLTNLRAAEAQRSGNPGPEGSIAKLALAGLNQAIYELAVELLGPAGQVDFDYEFRRSAALSDDGGWGGPRRGFLRVRANSIEGGTSEILRNIIGEQVLGLPGEPRVDKDPPWSQVPRS